MQAGKNWKKAGKNGSNSNVGRYIYIGKGKMVANNVGIYIYIGKGKMVASNVGIYIYIGKEKLWLSFLKLIVLTLLPTTASSGWGERCIRY